MGQGIHWSNWDTGQSPGQFQSASFTTLLLGISEHECALHKWNLFLTALLEVPLVFKLTKENCLPGVGPQGWDAQ